MSGPQTLPGISGRFEEIYPDLSFTAKSLASAIRADGVRVAGIASVCASARTIADARAAAARLPGLVERFLAELPPDPGGGS